MPAVLHELFEYRAFVWNLVFKDLKLKYRDSFLGVVWSLVNPLLMLTVYSFAFKFVLRVSVDNYPYFLLAGLLPWNFFSASLLASTGAITGNGSLIKKVYFPTETLPVATVLFCFAQFLLALVVFLPALVLISRAPLGWNSLLFFPLVLLHFLFTLGLAFALSALTTPFRDIAHLVEVALVLLFWVTPIIYSVDMAPKRLQAVFKASPLAAFTIAYQDVLVSNRIPEGLVIWTLLGWTVATLLTGSAIFRAHSPSFAEEV